jgi:hypothetical protein
MMCFFTLCNCCASLVAVVAVVVIVVMALNSPPSLVLIVLVCLGGMCLDDVARRRHRRRWCGDEVRDQEGEDRRCGRHGTAKRHGEAARSVHERLRPCGARVLPREVGVITQKISDDEWTAIGSKPSCGAR